MTKKETVRITQYLATLLDAGEVFVPCEEQEFFIGLRIHSKSVGLDIAKTNEKGTTFKLLD